MGAQETPRQEQGEISELDRKIIQQVEYYFGNYNLRKDRFLKEQMQLDDGWIPLEVMLKFNRLKSLSEDPAVIADALKKSQNQLLEVSDDDTKIRRCLDKPIPDYSPESRFEIARRTVYSKRFPASATLDELIQFFKGFGNVESVFMKKKPNKTFKGSVFVTFATQEEAQSFLKLGSVKYKKIDLLREAKEAYLKRKELEFEQRKLAKEVKQKKMEQDVKGGTPEEQLESLEKHITRGCVMKLSGLSETTSREHIMEAFKDDGEIAYLDYSRGKPEAFVRFSESIAESVLNKKSKEVDGCKKITINDAEALAVVLEGEIESEYWQKLLKARSQIRQRPHFKKGKGRFNPKTAGKDKSRFGKRRRHQNDTPEERKEKSDEIPEPPMKMIKTENSDLKTEKIDIKTEKTDIKTEKTDLKTEKND